VIVGVEFFVTMIDFGAWGVSGVDRQGAAPVSRGDSRRIAYEQ